MIDTLVKEAQEWLEESFDGNQINYQYIHDYMPVNLKFALFMKYVIVNENEAVFPQWDNPIVSSYYLALLSGNNDMVTCARNCIGIETVKSSKYGEKSNYYDKTLKLIDYYKLYNISPVNILLNEYDTIAIQYQGDKTIQRAKWSWYRKSMEIMCIFYKELGYEVSLIKYFEIIYNENIGHQRYKEILEDLENKLSQLYNQRWE